MDHYGVYDFPIFQQYPASSPDMCDRLGGEELANSAAGKEPLFDLVPRERDAPPWVREVLGTRDTPGVGSAGT
eukprot:3968202-Amphidinium_carterae.1